MSSFTYVVDIFKKTIFLLSIYVVLMTLSRLYLLFVNYESSFSNTDLINAFILGFRLDISVLGFVLVPVILVLFIVTFVNSLTFVKIFYKIIKLYLTMILMIVSLIVLSDLAFFSYFFDHINIMIFGILDDDTNALFEIAKQNYNLPLLGFLVGTFFIFLTIVVLKVLSFKELVYNKQVSFLHKVFFMIGIILCTFLIIRGSFGTFPLSKYIPDISENKFINSLPQNGIYALKKAIKDYKNSKEGTYDLIKENGYKGKMDKAFELFLNKKYIDKTDLTKNLLNNIPMNEQVEKRPPHVVLVMVESFGLPVLKYQSKSFNIMGALSHHFSEDIVFKNFISTGNGTISSLEALLLNITSRPNSTPLSQSKYLYTQFKSSAAKVYQDKGYETSFIYGGDLSWRNVGKFYSHQGFDNTYGKAAITKTLNLNSESVSHTWGVFDEISYKFVLDKLNKSTKPQFIFLLTTNNHPPYTIPPWYKSQSLEISNSLKNHITQDIGLATKRLTDYAYALDSAGEFMNKIKSSDLKENTIVGITADNNTIEGMMRYENYYDESKKIPFYLYIPKYLKKDYDSTVPGSHKDIFPTLYNLSLSSTSYTSIGTDLDNKNILHCGFNNAGVLMSKDGGFTLKNPITLSQKKCVKYYKASLSITEYLLNKSKKENNESQKKY